MINIAIIVIGIFIAITLLSNFDNTLDCTNITNTTLQGACNDAFNNAGVLYSLAAVLVLLLVIPMIRGVLVRNQ
jgi:hypothetical protein